MVCVMVRVLSGLWIMFVWSRFYVGLLTDTGQAWACAGMWVYGCGYAEVHRHTRVCGSTDVDTYGCLIITSGHGHVCGRLVGCS